MNGKFIKFFELNCFVESPIFKSQIKLKDKVEPISNPIPVTEEEITTAEEATPTEFDIYNTQTVTTPISIITDLNGKKVESKLIVGVNFDQWKNSGYPEEYLHRSISSVNNALKEISNKLLKLNVYYQNSDIYKQQIINILSESIPKVLNNPSFINRSNGNIDLQIINGLLNSIKNDSRYDELLDFMDENDLNIEEYLLSGNNIKLMIDESKNKEINAAICK